MIDLIDTLKDQLRHGEPCALCTIVSTKGSTPLKTGAKMLVYGSGEIVSTIGGGDFEKRVIENAVNVIKTRKSELFTHNLLQQHGMCCGGSLTVFIDYMKPPDRLYIFGAGHVGRSLAKFSSLMDFEVYLIDDRTKELGKVRDERINKLPFSFDEILPRLPFSDFCYVCIMTRDHELDRKILANCINLKHAYLGMIGSKRKIEVTRKMFISGGICTEDEFDRVDCPMGIDILAQNSDEIAISILAKLILVRGMNNKQVCTQKLDMTAIKHLV